MNTHFVGILNSWVSLPLNYTNLNVQQILMISRYTGFLDQTWYDDSVAYIGLILFSGCFQEIAYFDDHENAVGALTTRLATDASQVQGVSVEIYDCFGDFWM